MKYQVGDRVKIVGEFSYQNDKIGNGKIKSIEPSYGNFMNILFENGYENFYREKDLKLITNSKVTKITPYMRKKYILLKDTPNVKKGAIYEEMCDDGTQDFKLITPEYEKFPDKEYQSITRRKAVTNNPKWFKEVTLLYVAKEQVEKVKKFMKKLV